MVRKWLLAVLGAAALSIAPLTYHLFVIRHSAEHYRLLLESKTVAEKRLHYDEIHRYFHPWNPYREQSERWMREDGHEWEFLGKNREGTGGS